jgi:phosphatidylserine decarboxylase
VTASSELEFRRTAGWLPNQQDLEQWLAGHAQRVDERGVDHPLHPAAADLKALLDDDPVLGMYVRRMIEEVPTSKPYTRRHLTSPEQLVHLLDAVMTMAPEFGDEAVTLPMNAVLDWTMGTPSGFAFYRDPRVNAALKAILQAWGDYLSSPASLTALNDSPTGWTSPAAAQAIGIEQYEHEPDDPHWGFDSWNDFFTRRFRPGQRPVAAPDDDHVIVNACESTPYALRTGVQRHDTFWCKQQPYSLHDLLAGDPSIDAFIGGTVYQAFLSATDYHRWHSPVSGTVLSARVVDGTYFSEADSEGPAAVEAQNSQGYLAHVATRAVIVLRADEPSIGQLAVIAIGMSDVSTCVLHPDLAPGRHLSKGDELGHFAFGGSTHCLVLRPGAVDSFALHALPTPNQPRPPVIPVRSALAYAPR